MLAQFAVNLLLSATMTSNNYKHHMFFNTSENRNLGTVPMVYLKLV